MKKNLITPFTKELKSTIFESCTRYAHQTESFFLDVVALNQELGRFNVKIILHIKSGKNFLDETVKTVKKGVIFDSGVFNFANVSGVSAFQLSVKDFVCAKVNFYEYADRVNGLYFKAHFEGSISQEQAESLVSFSDRINGSANNS